jgi:hypothetical protein
MLELSLAVARPQSVYAQKKLGSVADPNFKKAAYRVEF